MKHPERLVVVRWGLARRSQFVHDLFHGQWGDYVVLVAVVEEQVIFART